jgi:uncharacterized protein (TIGR03067 family)
MNPRWLAVVLGVLLALGPVRGEDKKTDADEIQDTWRIVAIEADGKKQEMGQAAKDGSARAVISADKITLRAINGALGLYLEMTYKIDTGKKPKALDVTLTEAEGKGVKGRKCQGIYSLRGDKLKFCIDLSGKQRPAAFDTSQGDGLLLFYLERE